jgi:hypothetical protein
LLFQNKILNVDTEKLNIEVHNYKDLLKNINKKEENFTLDCNELTLKCKSYEIDIDNLNKKIIN